MGAPEQLIKIYIYLKKKSPEKSLVVRVRVWGRRVAILSAGRRMGMQELLRHSVPAGLHAQAAEMVAL